MCRNIKQLHNFEPPATDDEVLAAALQYVRKIVGTTKPSKANEQAFTRAVDAVAHISRHLLDELVTAAEHRLVQALDDIAAGHYPPRPETRNLCGMCAFVAVCRHPGGLPDDTGVADE